MKNVTMKNITMKAIAIAAVVCVSVTGALFTGRVTANAAEPDGPDGFARDHSVTHVLSASEISDGYDAANSDIAYEIDILDF